MKKRKFYKDIINHGYQRTADGGVLFYTQSDHLVYFTIYCTVARKYGVKVLSLCQMPDHLHDAVTARTYHAYYGFKQEVNSRFAKEYNEQCQSQGPVFETPFGSAPKAGIKKGRSNLIYIANNAVERQLVTRAEDYRWNYLAYSLSSHPFSDPIVIRHASKALRTALRIAEAQFKAGRPLNYTLLKNLTKDLTPGEIQQFTDRVVSLYNVIDYAEASRYFETLMEMFIAIHADTGSEFDLNETFVGKSDKPYAQMTRILLETGKWKDIHEILALSRESKLELFELLREQTSVMGEQIGKYLHLPIVKK